MSYRSPLSAILLAILFAFAARSASAAPGAETPATDPTVIDAARAAALAAAGLALSGTWYSTELIVFDRPRVDPAHFDEQLLDDAPRSLPGNLRSIEPPGSQGAVFYSASPADPACRLSTPASTARGASGSGALVSPIPAPGPTNLHPSPAEVTDRVAATVEPAVPADPLQVLRLTLQKYEKGLEDQSNVWLPRSSLTLAVEARRLAENGGFRILFHGAWLQNLADKDFADPILIQAERADATGPQLEGTVRFGRGGATRFETLLWYDEFNTAPGATQYVELREERRLVSGELHYIDHPKLGVLVRTVAVPVPAEVINAFEALNPPAAATPGAGVPSGSSLPRSPDQWHQG